MLNCRRFVVGEAEGPLGPRGCATRHDSRVVDAWHTSRAVLLVSDSAWR